MSKPMKSVGGNQLVEVQTTGYEGLLHHPLFSDIVEEEEKLIEEEKEKAKIARPYIETLKRLLESKDELQAPGS